ncbi:MAG TPA: type II secretion system minor pseudopilin GspI [Dokdonella sp.]|uniref:type II secretion system minor pseudopilin GspI n=1 Tax=Dokdonella sp. TaxID=2291710 RepID=UPI002D7F4BCD|nr:type II secretion system minor pseudopilin GspI [Dokdonella sp.]HET9031389.1 type II secretion system minor pseudopilin GspI [Dokdonella sp.]
MSRQRGFTLLEVLIALVVVALALLALTRTAGGQINSFDGLRERTLAGWVASNVLNETRIATPFPGVGKRDGRTRFGDRDWRWTLEVKATDDPSMRRLTVLVFAADSTEPSASLDGFGSDQPSP